MTKDTTKKLIMPQIPIMLAMNFEDLIKVGALAIRRKRKITAIFPAQRDPTYTMSLAYRSCDILLFS